MVFSAIPFTTARTIVKNRSRKRFAGTLLTALVLAGLLLPSGGQLSAQIASTAAAPGMRPRAYLPQVLSRQSNAVSLGVYFPPDYGTYDQQIRDFQSTVGKKQAIYHYFIDWRPDFAFNKHLLDTIVASGSTPMITWMSIPATGDKPLGCGDPNWNLDSIVNGAHDAYIRSFAQGMAGYGHTVLLRWGHEMNLVDYSWSGYCNNNDTGKFITAFRHIHDIFRQQGARNVLFVWSPNYQSWPGESWNDINAYYPGDDYVDWIGVVGYNWGHSSSNSNYRWMPFTMIFDSFLRDQAARHPSKPQMIADYASVEDDGGSKTDWIAQAFAAMPYYPNLRAAIWYDHDDAGSFTVDSSQASLAAYRSAITPAQFSSQAPYP